MLKARFCVIDTCNVHVCTCTIRTYVALSIIISLGLKFGACVGVLTTAEWPPAQKTRLLRYGTPHSGHGKHMCTYII